MKTILVTILAVGLSQAVTAVELTDPISKDNSPDCGCYLTSGPDPGYFQYHRFWDFRNIASDGDNDFTTAPDRITGDQSQGTEQLTSNYFTSSKFQADWSILGDVERQDSPFRTVNSPQNVYITRNTTEGAGNSTYLTLRTNRLEDFMSTAEMDSKQNNVLHSSIRARFRVIPNFDSPASSNNVTDSGNSETNSSASHPVDEGAVVGLFTYFNDTQEADIEILTKEPTVYVHYTNQPDYDNAADMEIPGASSNLSLPDGLLYTDWIDHRIDWFEGISRWFVNGQFILDKSQNAPTVPSALILNLWGDGGSWSGNMSVGGQVTMGIEWVEMLFNVSGDVMQKSSLEKDHAISHLSKRESDVCQVACNVDGVKRVGFPELAYNSTSTSAGASFMVHGEVRSLLVAWLPLGIVLVYFMF